MNANDLEVKLSSRIKKLLGIVKSNKDFDYKKNLEEMIRSKFLNRKDMSLMIKRGYK